ncbi:MAG TPA: hypothetical protein VFV86_00945 [Nitrososphaeraceae archaeon]|nr:hypothetical protein [Nitrososphaeraceae archaeon]
MDVKDAIAQIENKEQKEQCEKFLDRVTTLEIQELIAKYIKKEIKIDNS